MALPPLVRGELRPRAITVIRPLVDAIRHADGSFTLAMPPLQQAAPEEATAPPSVAAGGATPPGGHPWRVVARRTGGDWHGVL